MLKFNEPFETNTDSPRIELDTIIHPMRELQLVTGEKALPTILNNHRELPWIPAVAWELTIHSHRSKYINR